MTLKAELQRTCSPGDGILGREQRDQGWAIMRSWSAGGCVGEPAYIAECELRSLETGHHRKAVAPSPVLKSTGLVQCLHFSETAGTMERKNGISFWGNIPMLVLEPEIVQS